MDNALEGFSGREYEPVTPERPILADPSLGLTPYHMGSLQWEHRLPSERHSGSHHEGGRLETEEEKNLEQGKQDVISSVKEEEKYEVYDLRHTRERSHPTKEKPKAFDAKSPQKTGGPVKSSKITTRSPLKTKSTTKKTRKRSVLPMKLKDAFYKVDEKKIKEADKNRAIIKELK